MQSSEGRICALSGHSKNEVARVIRSLQFPFFNSATIFLESSSNYHITYDVFQCFAVVISAANNVYFGTLLISLSNRCSTKINRSHICMFSCLIQCSHTSQRTYPIYSEKWWLPLCYENATFGGQMTMFKAKRFFNSFFWPNIRPF